MADDTPATRSPPRLPIEVWQLVMDAVWDATTYTTFYTNQAAYRAWALVCRAWRPCAQSVLFRTVELPDATLLRRFAALLRAAPHLAAYVRTLRAYSRDLHTRDNVVALLPAVLSSGNADWGGGGVRLPNLRTLLLTRITAQDTWHPHAARSPCAPELQHMPLDLSLSAPHQCSSGRGDFYGGLAADFAGLSELYLSYVTFETFGALARTLHALQNLRLLSCLEVRWCALGPLPECLTGKGGLKGSLEGGFEGEGVGEGTGQGQGQGRGDFLPKLEELTIAYMDLHGVERLLAALGRSAALKELYIDCPHYSPFGVWSDPPLVDPATGTPLGIDLRAFARLGTLWLALPYTCDACKDLPALVAALLRTWAPTDASARAQRKLTLTPSYESDFERAEFADVLRALGPVIEDVFGACEEGEGKEGKEGKEGNTDPEEERERRGLAEVEVEVCAVDREDKRDWWREEARASFARLGARGRLAVTFEKCFWPEAQWQDDSDDLQTVDMMPPAQQATEGGAAEAHGVGPGERLSRRSSVLEGRVSETAARRRRGSMPSRLARLRPPNLKKAFHMVRRGLLKLTPSRLLKRRRKPGSGAPEVVFVGT